MEEKQTPLIELLERVPQNARCRVDEPDGMGSVFIPVGKLCHEAAAALRAALAEPVETVGKTPAWWMDGLAATLMREGVNKHRAKEIAKGYWETYCQVPMDEEQPK